MSGDDGEDREDEAALFRAAVRGVRPLKDSGQLTPARGGTRVRAALGRAQRAAALRESQQRASSPVHAVDGTDLYELQPGDELVFRRAVASTTSTSRSICTAAPWPRHRRPWSPSCARRASAGCTACASFTARGCVPATADRC